jgi:glutamine amidotransferase-like uncharacterized protein
MINNKKIMIKILIFNDKGSDKRSVQELLNCFKLVYKNKFEIIQINSNYILSGNLESNNLLIIGGGYDLGYLECLGEHGCLEIRKFVQSGGFYLGICAGAYFASNYIEFDLNGELEVKGERFLKLFNGKAIGPLNKFQYVDNDNYSIAARILLNDIDLNLYQYLNGGCYFEPFDLNYKQIACYQHSTKITSLNEDKKIAILECNVEKGIVLLSGVHFEYDANNLDNKNIFDKLQSNKINLSILSKDLETNLNSEQKHSNHEFIKYLLNKTFNIC